MSQEERQERYKRATALAEKVDLKGWEWVGDGEDLFRKISERAARVVIAQLMIDKMVVTWRGDEVHIEFGPLKAKFTKADLSPDEDTPGEFYGWVEVGLEYDGRWEGG